jgi:hypothetical protein
MLYKILIKLQFSRQVFGKYSNIKLNENPFSGKRVLSCVRTDGQGDITKLIVALSSFVTASTKACEIKLSSGKLLGMCSISLKLYSAGGIARLSKQ